jgi:hypothetical protein
MRKPITQVKGNTASNLEDKNATITNLLKRMCTFEEAVDYLLSDISEIHKDDMIGELLTWDNKHLEMKRIRNKEKLASFCVPSFNFKRFNVVCDSCKKSFTTRTSNQKYCSPKCWPSRNSHG